MTFDFRLAVIALATFATASVAGSLATLWLTRRVSGSTAAPAARARAWFRLRMLPVLVALVATTQGLVSFVLFEPRGGEETFGRVLVALAAAAAALLVSSIVRLSRAAIATRRALRRWMMTATPVTLPGVTIPAFAVDSAFPVVAVVGVRHPSLIVAKRVIDACTSEELDAIFAHERRHLVNRDNIRRAILLSLPDPLSFLPVGGRLNARWHDAVEEAADDAAATIGALGRTNLASALVRVARLAPSGLAAVRLPASALYRGENIDRRVRRLLGRADPIVDVAWPMWQRVAMGTAIVVAGGLALHAMHELVELAASRLP